MRKSKFSDEQIIGILKSAEAGVAVTDVCRRHGISGHTYYRWRSKYGGLRGREAAEHVLDASPQIDAGLLAGQDERVQPARHVASALATEDEPVLAAEREMAQVALFVVVVNRDAHVDEEGRQRCVLPNDVFHGVAKRALGKRRTHPRQLGGARHDERDELFRAALAHARA